MLLLLVASFALTSCGDDDPDSSHPLTGKWVCVEGDVGFTYEFNEDGSGVAYWSPTSRHDYFTDYSVSGGILKFIWDGDDEWDEAGTIEIDGNRFYTRWSSDPEDPVNIFQKQ